MSLEMNGKGYRAYSKTFEDVYALIDKKREILLFWGVEDYVTEKFKSLYNKCVKNKISNQFESDIRIVSTKNTPFDEMRWMLHYYKVPRRLKMRLEKNGNR